MNGIETEVPTTVVTNVDKLEIQMEEANIKENCGVEFKNGEVEIPLTPEVSEEKKNPIVKKSRLSIKIPDILRLRSKEKEKSVDEKSCGENGTSNGSVPPEDVHVVEEKIENVDCKIEENGDDVDVSATSFLSSFSTPRWTNFRRVFSFNRSTPAPLAAGNCEESVIPVSVTLNIPEEDENCKNGKKTEEDAKADIVEAETSQNGKTKPCIQNQENEQRNYRLIPLLRIFKARRGVKTSENHIDIESCGEAGTELLEKKVDEESNAEVQKNGNCGDKEPIGIETETNGDIGTTVPEKEMKQEDKPVEISSPTKPWRDLSWNERFIAIEKRRILIIGIAVLLFLALLILLLIFCQPSKAIDISSLIIFGKYINTITSCGHVQGTLEDGGYVFRGIPYALPPVGELRWRPAQTHFELSQCWNGTFHAKNHSMPCWQFYRNGSYDGSEDCLYLDVYTPKPYYDYPVPVVVFIGGESLNGGQSSSLIPSAKLAKQKNVVFVSVSIRRSVLGFLAVQPLSQSSYPMTSGNYGLSDLIAALTWVKLNAQHFGGDPHHVTLLGHQSGASLALALLSSQGHNQGLFHQIWTSGGSPPTSLISLQDAEAQNAEFLKEIGCSTIECLHNKGPEELLESVPKDWRIFHQDLPNRGEKRHHWLIRDGLILRDPIDKSLDLTPKDQLPSDSPVKIPFVAGTGAEVDASAEMYSYLDWNESSKFSSYLESSLGSFGASLSREVNDRYFRPETTPWQTFTSLLSDVRTICPLYYATLSRADPYTPLPVYFYVVTHRKTTPYGVVADGKSDIAAIFGTYNSVTKEDKKFVQNMQKLFYEFVEKGKLPGPDVTKSIFKVEDSIQKIFTYPNCDFWQEHSFFPNYTRVD